jgi:hypothetical protein
VELPPPLPPALVQGIVRLHLCHVLSTGTDWLLTCYRRLTEEILQLLAKEVKVTEEAVKRNPKVNLSLTVLFVCLYACEVDVLYCNFEPQSYWVWHHRRLCCEWIEEKGGDPQWAFELTLCTKFHKLDARNCTPGFAIVVAVA